MRGLIVALLVASASAFTPIRTRSRGLRAAAATRRPASSSVTPSMLGVVITGGANGVGFGYADEFLARRHSVVICDVKDPAAAVAALKAKHPNGEIYGVQCDVSSTEAVDNLAATAKEKLGLVHYWINNAGINGGRRAFSELSYGTIEAVVKVNLLGSLLCTQAAMKLMAEQSGTIGHVFNTVGSGVKGGGTPGYVVYGATKRGLPQMTDSLVAELEKGVQGYDKKSTAGKVNVHTLSPGMVFTQLLLDDSTPELRKFPFGVLAAQPEEVAADLVPKILGVKGNGQKVEFLTTDRILNQFYKKFVLGEKSEYIDDDGNVIKRPDAQYDELGVKTQY
mmetsp:Transcript_23642/g.54528  ORF Transcript_23642/g.54528 Transcript_23642/m.54528 type:complete len:336 (+) Transcript_23642:58-1065(+)